MYLCFTKVFDFYYLFYIFIIDVSDIHMCFELQIYSNVQDSFISL